LDKNGGQLSLARGESLAYVDAILTMSSTELMFQEELWLDYPNELFIVKGDANEENGNAKIQRTSYDITTNPHMPCTAVSYDKCIRKEVIQIYNKTLGCTFPIQR
jgi:hypothetical protein